MSVFEDVASPRPLAHSPPLLLVAVHHSQFDMPSIFFTTRAFGGGEPGGGGGGGDGGLGGGGGGGVEAVAGGCAPGRLFAAGFGLPPQPIRKKAKKTQIRIEIKKEFLGICTELRTPGNLFQAGLLRLAVFRVNYSGSMKIVL